MRDSCKIIGVECATNPKNVGLAYGLWLNGSVRFTEVTNGQLQVPEEIIYKWTHESESCLSHARVLLAMDALLGWPQDLGRALASHMAGMPLQAEPNLFFRRETDRFVQRNFGKTPFDVGADRIARTALFALELLDAITKRTG